MSETNDPLETVLELVPAAGTWQVTLDGTVLVCAVERRGAINAAAALLRPRLDDQEAVARFRFVGLVLTELMSAPCMDPNWKRKGPPIDLALFEQAERFLQTGYMSEEETALAGDYQSALHRGDYDRALDCLMQLGERQGCTNRYWKVLEQLIDAVWPTEWMVDRRAKGQRETKIATIKRRAQGRA